jgi:hypothetical protein
VARRARSRQSLRFGSVFEHALGPFAVQGRDAFARTAQASGSPGDEVASAARAVNGSAESTRPRLSLGQGVRVRDVGVLPAAHRGVYPRW